MVFLEKKNIAKSEHLVQAATDAGLDAGKFEYDYQHEAKQLFENDLAMAREWGVRGYPTIYFMDQDDNRFKVYGSKPYQVYEQALLKLLPGEVTKETTSTYEKILEGYETVTLKEFAIFYDKSIPETEAILNDLEQQKKVQKSVSKAGPLWRKITN